MTVREKAYIDQNNFLILLSLAHFKIILHYFTAKFKFKDCYMFTVIKELKFGSQF